MVVSDQASDDLVRELYARFGLAYYHGECLHRGLCIIFAMYDLPRPELITGPLVEVRLAHAFTLTLGDVACKLKGVLPQHLLSKLDKVVNTRNFLAHHFFFERAHLMFRTEDINGIIEELNGYSELFIGLDEETSEWFKPKRDELGITESVLHQHLSRLIAGELEEPLPDKNSVKKLEKKLRGRQRLVRIWEIPLPDDGKSLIFETEGGGLWQPCDIGLGWTRYTQVGPEWSEHPITRPYLPATIISRPKNVKPWEYEFTLKKGAVLWIKPGGKPRTFKWGLRTRKLGGK